MLTIRKEQFEVFERLALENFADDTVDFLLIEYPDAVEHLSAVELRERVGYALARAWGMGMRTDVALQDFTALIIMYGPRFDQYPAVRKILVDETIPPDDRINALTQELPRRIWDELAILVSNADWSEPDRSNRTRDNA